MSAIALSLSLSLEQVCDRREVFFISDSVLCYIHSSGSDLEKKKKAAQELLATYIVYTSSQFLTIFYLYHIA